MQLLYTNSVQMLQLSYNSDVRNLDCAFLKFISWLFWKRVDFKIAPILWKVIRIQTSFMRYPTKVLEGKKSQGGKNVETWALEGKCDLWGKRDFENVRVISCGDIWKDKTSEKSLRPNGNRMIRFWARVRDFFLLRFLLKLISIQETIRF